MKKIFSVLFVIILFTFSVSAAPERIIIPNSNAELTMPDGYETLTYENMNSKEEFLKEIGTTPSEMSAYFTSLYIETYGYSPNRENEIYLQVYKIEGMDLFDLKDASEQELKLLEDNIRAEDSITIERLEILDDDRGRFFRVEGFYNESQFREIKYLTVKNGANFMISFLKKNSAALSEDDIAQADFVFNSFQITRNLSNPNSSRWLLYLLIAVAVLVSGAIIFVVIKRVRGWDDSKRLRRN